jgi:hypothetical protein
LRKPAFPETIHDHMRRYACIPGIDIYFIGSEYAAKAKIILESCILGKAPACGLKLEGSQRFYLLYVQKGIHRI